MVILQQGFYKMVLATKAKAGQGTVCRAGLGKLCGPCVSTEHHVLTGIPAAAHEISGFLTKLHLLSPSSLCRNCSRD